MSRIKLLGTIGAGPALAMLAVLLLLSGTALPGITRAQDGPENYPCARELGLPAELDEDELGKLRAVLQELVDADPEATITVLIDGEVLSTIHANLLLADEAVLVALIESQPFNVTFDYSQVDGEPPEIIAIEASTAEDCSTPDVCVPLIDLPAALADLDVAGLREALEGLIAGDPDTTVTVGFFENEAVVRADLLLGLSDPVLGAVLAGEPLSVTVTSIDENEIVGIVLPGPECEVGGGTPGPVPTVVAIPDNQQDGGKDTTPDNQQGGGDKVPDNQQTGDDKDTGAGGKTPDNQQGGVGDTVTKTFELTLNGTVPADGVFAVQYGTAEEFETGRFGVLYVCGLPLMDVPELRVEVISDEDCVGGGNTYRHSVELPQGTELYFGYFTGVEATLDTTAEIFFGNITDEGLGDPEVLNADTTNTAWYTFGKGTGAGDDQQAGDDKGTGAGDDQQTPDNQQDDTQDDQQGQMPEELPDTGAGGLAPGATNPVGNAATGLMMLGGACYAVLRRR